MCITPLHIHPREQLLTHLDPTQPRALCCASALRFPQVRAAQQEEHLKLRQVIAQAFTAFLADSDDQERHRARLLAPSTAKKPPSQPRRQAQTPPQSD
jgi:hypothetical protein